MLAVMLVFIMHLRALGFGLRMQFNEMCVVRLLRHAEALGIGLGIHFIQISAAILVF